MYGATQTHSQTCVGSKPVSPFSRTVSSRGVRLYTCVHFLIGLAWASSLGESHSSVVPCVLEPTLHLFCFVFPLGVSSLLHSVVGGLFPSFYWPSWSLCCFNRRASLSVSNASNLSGPLVRWRSILLLVSFVAGYLSDAPAASEPCFLALSLSVFWTFPPFPFALVHPICLPLFCVLPPYFRGLFPPPSPS